MDVLFVLGVIVAIFLVDRVGRVKLRISGFIGCATGLLLSGLSIRPDGGNVMWLPFLGFTPFYFMANFGPNAMTNLLAGEVFPTEVRGIGAGLAASFAKARGALAAYLFRIETAGVNLEDVGNVATSGIAGSESPPLPGTPFVDGGRITSPSAPGAARWS